MFKNVIENLDVNKSNVKQHNSQDAAEVFREMEKQIFSYYCKEKCLGNKNYSYFGADKKLTDRVWSELLYRVGDWGKGIKYIRKKDKNGRFKAFRFAESFRGGVIEVSKKMPAEKVHTLVRSICRVYLFLLPTKRMLSLCCDYAEHHGVDLLPGSIVLDFENSQRNLRIKCSFKEILLSSENYAAMMFYAFYGTVTPEFLEYLLAIETKMSVFKVTTDFGWLSDIVGISEDSFPRETLSPYVSFKQRRNRFHFDSLKAPLKWEKEHALMKWEDVYTTVNWHRIASSHDLLRYSASHFLSLCSLRNSIDWLTRDEEKDVDLKTKVEVVDLKARGSFFRKAESKIVNVDCQELLGSNDIMEVVKLEQDFLSSLSSLWDKAFKNGSRTLIFSSPFFILEDSFFENRYDSPMNLGVKFKETASPFYE